MKLELVANVMVLALRTSDPQDSPEALKAGGISFRLTNFPLYIFAFKCVVGRGSLLFHRFDLECMVWFNVATVQAARIRMSLFNLVGCMWLRIRDDWNLVC